MRKETLAKTLTVLACLFMLSAPTAWADPCTADINYDGKYWSRLRYMDGRIREI